jgi:hypothetical protein
MCKVKRNFAIFFVLAEFFKRLCWLKLNVVELSYPRDFQPEVSDFENAIRDRHFIKKRDCKLESVLSVHYDPTIVDCHFTVSEPHL